MKGTIKEIEQNCLVNGAKLSGQEWYALIRILERSGKLHEVAKKDNVGAGRKSRVFEIPTEVSISFTEKEG